LIFLSSYEKIDVVPILHRNTLNFLGMSDRDYYLASKVIKDRFIALKNTNSISSWNILNGKILFEEHLKKDQDYSNFEVFKPSKSNVVYQREWY
jgi:hypothetical protein